MIDDEETSEELITIDNLSRKMRAMGRMLDNVQNRAYRIAKTLSGPSIIANTGTEAQYALAEDAGLIDVMSSRLSEMQSQLTDLTIVLGRLDSVICDNDDDADPEDEFDSEGSPAELNKLRHRIRGGDVGEIRKVINRNRKAAGRSC